MKACILYFSQTGNTKQFAESISESLETEAVFDMTTTEPSVVEDYEVVIIGTPVHGFNPSKEALSFVEKLPEGDNKRAVLFCTCRIWKGSTFKKLEKELKKKKYTTVLKLAKKGKEFSKEDFSDAACKISTALKK